jgi:hypothetical protein
MPTTTAVTGTKKMRRNPSRHAVSRQVIGIATVPMRREGEPQRNIAPFAGSSVVVSPYVKLTIPKPTNAMCVSRSIRRRSVA